MSISLFDGFLDDAAVFPPGSSPIGEALIAHRRHLTKPYAAMVNGLVVSAEHLPDLVAALLPGRRESLTQVIPAGNRPVEQAVVSALLATDATEGLDLQSLEVTATNKHEVAAVARQVHARGISGAIEIGPPGSLGLLKAIADNGLTAKLRTGGLHPGAFPSPAAVAAFLVACRHVDVPFKCTAGLHRAVRHHDDETCFTHHGFLNVLAATDAAERGAEAHDLIPIIKEQDRATLVDLIQSLDRAARRRFLSIGTCSIKSPVSDLRNLGLVRA